MTTTTAKTSGATRLRWLAFSAALGASLMDLLDSTIASVAAPAIRADLGGSYADLQWIAAAYTLAMAVMLLTGGRLGDIFGRKRVLLVGVAGFTLASVGCALAPTTGALIAARALQGALGAVMLPQVFGLIRDIFPPQEMGKAFAVFGPACGLSAILGPIVAGLLIDADPLGLGWRSVFAINVPVGLFVLALGARTIPEVAPVTRDRRIDLPGVLIAGAGAGMLVYALVQGHELGWPLWVVGMAALAIPVLAVFGRRQVARKRAGRATLIEPSVFANRSYVSGVVFATVFLGTMAGLGIILGVLLQVGLGYQPIDASIATAPYALGGFVGSAVGGTMVAKLGRSILQAGLLVKLAGIGALYLVLHEQGGSVGAWDLTLPLLVAGIGMGMVFVPLFDIILGGLADHEVGSASGVLQAVQQLGMSLGVAVFGTVLFGALGFAEDRGVDFAHAAELTTLIAIVLLLAASAITLLMPRHVRGHEDAGAAAPVLA